MSARARRNLRAPPSRCPATSSRRLGESPCSYMRFSSVSASPAMSCRLSRSRASESPRGGPGLGSMGQCATLGLLPRLIRIPRPRIAFQLAPEDDDLGVGQDTQPEVGVRLHLDQDAPRL